MVKIYFRTLGELFRGFSEGSGNFGGMLSSKTILFS